MVFLYEKAVAETVDLANKNLLMKNRSGRKMFVIRPVNREPAPIQNSASFASMNDIIKLANL